MYSRNAYIVLLAGTLVWCVLILLAPLVVHSNPAISNNLYSFFKPVCHQDDARSFHIAGVKFAVCIRCSAIYFSFLVGVLLFPMLRRRTISLSSRSMWLIAVVSMLIDVLLDTVGIHASTTWTRTITGGMFGFIAAQLIVPLILQAFTDIAALLSYLPAHSPPQSQGRVYGSKTN